MNLIIFVVHNLLGVDYICTRMNDKGQKHPMGYWNNKEHCLAAAKQVSSYAQLRKTYPAAYKSCLRHPSWLKDIRKIFPSDAKPRGWWQNPTNCAKAASKCKTQKEFREKYFRAYESCRSHDWGSAILESLTVLRDIKKWSTFEAIHEEALKYPTPTRFQRGNGSAYQAARRLGILDQVCSHMVTNGYFEKRGIYAFEFPDNHVYVGLTYNFVVRKCDHLLKDTSQVYRYMKKTGLEPVFKVLHEYTDMKKAKVLEGEYLQRYIDAGWVKLNVQQTGNLGGSQGRLTRKYILAIAHSCETLNEFRLLHDDAYQAARKHRWLDEIKKFLPTTVNQFGSFLHTYEGVIELTRRCKTYREFFLADPPAVSFARRHGFINEIQAILPPSRIIKRSINKHTHDSVMELAHQCADLAEFYRHGGAYNAAINNGWLEEVHKILPTHQHQPYTEDEVYNKAKKYETYQEFREANGSMYAFACSHKNVLEKIQTYFRVLILEKYGYEEVLEIAKQCSNYQDFRTNHAGAYLSAKSHKWLNDVKKVVPRVIHSIYSKEKILNIASSCQSYNDFTRNHASAYQVARRHPDWLAELNMMLPRKVSKPYTLEKILQLAEKYTALKVFAKEQRNAYKSALRNKSWLEALHKILPPTKHPYYTKDDIMVIVSKCQTYAQFRLEYASAYQTARTKGWLDEIKVILPSQVRNKYTENEIMEAALECSSLAEFRKRYRNRYKAAYKRKMLDKIKDYYK